MVFFRKYGTWMGWYLLLGGIICLRIYVERTHYISPDSRYYLEVADNIQKGLGPVGPQVFALDSTKTRLIPLFEKTPFGQPESYDPQYFAVWPLGYPFSIFSVSKALGVSSFLASKILNIVLLGFDFWFLALLFPQSRLVAYYFGSFAMLEILSYTWSENLFLTLWLVWFYFGKKNFHETNPNPIFRIGFFVCLALMPLVRYASVVFFVGGLGWIWMGNQKKSTKKLAIEVFGLALAATCVAIYLGINYFQTGYPTGMPRLGNQEFSWDLLLGKLVLGLWNAIHLVKECRLSPGWDTYYYVVLIIVQLLGMVYTLRKVGSKTFSPNSVDVIWLWQPALYLLFLVTMTFQSTIDPFDYRTLMPAVFPVWIYVLSKIDQPSSPNYLVIGWKWFLVVAAVLNVPKAFLIQSIF